MTDIEAARKSITAALIGSCECNTKSPEATYHAAHCRYLKLLTALDYLDDASAAKQNIESETFVIDNPDSSISLDAYHGKTREELKEHCRELVAAVDEWQFAAMHAATEGGNSLDNVREPHRSQIARLIDAYSDDEPKAHVPAASAAKADTDLIKRAEQYLAFNAAESGADELIRELVAALRFPAASAAETPSGTRYFEFREKVEALVFDPVRRGGRTEAEILAELERMCGYANEYLKPQPHSPAENVGLSDIEHLIVDYFKANKADVFERDGEWFIDVDEDDASLTALATAFLQQFGVWRRG